MDMNRQDTEALRVPRTRRRHDLSVLTSMPAGKAVPLAAIPLLREDSLSASFNINLEMLETKEILMNSVAVRVTAYVVPFLALERFEGSRDQFDRSYMGQPKVDGGSVVPFFETHAMGAHGSKAFYKYLGLHAKTADNVNTAYLEAYNAIWNFRARNRSPNITKRTRLDASLAPAFWQHTRFQHIVPSFNQAAMDGAVALNEYSKKVPVNGIGVRFQGTVPSTAVSREAGDVSVGASRLGWTGDPSAASGADAKALIRIRPRIDGTSGLPTEFPDIWSDITAEGFSLSLANIDLARQARAFAKLRERYEQLPDDYIIDMLMDGLSIPDQHLKQPMLIGDRTVSISQVKRYATDAGNLAESAVSGGANLSMNIRVPRLETGGVVIIQAEAVPEQLWERQRDPLFHLSDVALLPEFIRDAMDPQKVQIVQNGDIDTDHSLPSDTFGYEPMNGRWTRFGPRVGGKFYRPTVNAPTDTDRQRLWAIETVDPRLGSSFYVVNTMHLKPFLDQATDPFEATVSGAAAIEGNTQFGGVLIEGTENFQKLMERVPTDFIDQNEAETPVPH